MTLLAGSTEPNPVICTECGADITSCQIKEGFSSRACCDSCTHTTKETKR
jgi:hypothetical protein